MMLLLSLWLLWVGIAPPVFAQSSAGAGGSEIKGDVLYWEGQEVVVREMSGHEVRLLVTSDTKIEGTSSKLKTGDKIAAKVAPDGHASSITLQIPDNTAQPRP